MGDLDSNWLGGFKECTELHLMVMFLNLQVVCLEKGEKIYLGGQGCKFVSNLVFCRVSCMW